LGKTEREKEEIKLYNKFQKDAILSFWNEMQDGEAILVCNWKKRGIENYIGGNSFLEMGFAHVLNQKIFLLYPIPDIDLYRTEIEAMHPIVIGGDLSKIT